jgi:uncharacterized membrane protein YbhN (UPF0104 family)
MNLKPKLIFLLKLAFWAALIYFCIAFLIPKWRELRLTERLTALHPGWLLAAGLGFLAHYLYHFSLWALLIRRLGSRSPLKLLFRAYSLSLLPKYIPGKVAAAGVRARLALQADVAGTDVSASLIWETLFIVGSAALLGLLGLFGNSLEPLHEAARLLVLALVIGCTGFVTLAVAGILDRRWTRWIGLPQLRRQPRWILGFLLLYGATWLTYGVGHFLLANAVMPLPPVMFLPLSVALAVSWSVGFVSFIAPAGLGVREGVLYLFVVPVLGPGQALLFVTLSRVIAFAVEALLTFVWATIWLLDRAGGARAKSPEDHDA